MEEHEQTTVELPQPSGPLGDAAPPASGDEDDSSRVVVATVIRPLLPHEVAGARCFGASSRCVRSNSCAARALPPPPRRALTARAPPRRAEGATEAAFAAAGEPQASGPRGSATRTLRRAHC